MLQDKLKRRNTQIADLKARLKEVKNKLAYLEQHLLVVEEYHPDYLKDIENNQI